MRTPKTKPEELLLQTTRAYIGERSRALRINGFSAKTGYSGEPWAGSFLEVCVREAGINYSSVPSLTAPTAALAWFVQRGLTVKTPRVGDLVFFAFTTDEDAFVGPHIGLVTDTENWNIERSFHCIEGQTATGLPKGIQDRDGVYERRRFATDVLTFVRPHYSINANPNQPEGLPSVRPSDFQYGKTSPKTVLLQQALARVTKDSNFNRGKYDAKTRAAYANWQRQIGLVGADASGMPDERSLRRLAQETVSIFRVGDRP